MTITKYEFFPMCLVALMLILLTITKRASFCVWSHVILLSCNIRVFYVLLKHLRTFQNFPKIRKNRISLKHPSKYTNKTHKFANYDSKLSLLSFIPHVRSSKRSQIFATIIWVFSDYLQSPSLSTNWNLFSQGLE